MYKFSASIPLFVLAALAFAYGAATYLIAMFAVGTVLLVAAFYVARRAKEKELSESRSASSLRAPELAEQVERLQQSVDALTKEVERLNVLESSGSTETVPSVSRVTTSPKQPERKAPERGSYPVARKADGPKPQPARPQAISLQAQSVSEKVAERDTPRRLRGLMISGSESRTPKGPTEEEVRHLQRIADSFFADRDRVLAVPSGDLSADRLQVMTELYLFLKASHHSGPPPFASGGTRAEKDQIDCFHSERTHSERCYDGGCSGFESEHYRVEEKLHISIVDEERWDFECSRRGDQKGFHPARRWDYYGALKNDDALVLLTEGGELYLHHPFGSVFVFLFDWQYSQHYLGEW